MSGALRVRNLPAFLKPLPRRAARRRTFAALVAAQTLAPQSSRVATATMTGQEQSYWCWAASTQCIRRSRSLATQSQADIAHGHVRRAGRTVTCTTAAGHTGSPNSSCGVQPCQAECNTPHWLRIVLTEHSLFGATVFPAPVGLWNFTVLRTEINGGRPVACRVASSGGHFIVIVGWSIGSDGVDRVEVLDPAAPGRVGLPVSPVLVTFHDLMSASGTNGWQQVTHSYTVN